MNSVGHARHYLSGLLGTQRRKNFEVIGQDVKGSDYQGLEQFISASPWDHREVMDQVARDADVLLGDEQRAGLYIDESSFLKKGYASSGRAAAMVWTRGQGRKLPDWRLRLFGPRSTGVPDPLQVVFAPGVDAGLGPAG